METVTVRGEIYEIGEPYTIDNDGEIGYLHSYDFDLGHFVVSIKGDLTAIHATPKLIRAIDSVGTITDAPMELENYDVCEFEVNGFRSAGIFNKERNCFMNAGNKVCGFNEAVKIVPLREK